MVGLRTRLLVPPYENDLSHPLILVSGRPCRQSIRATLVIDGDRSFLVG